MLLGRLVLTSLSRLSWLFKSWAGLSLSAKRFLLDLDPQTTGCCLRRPTSQFALGVLSLSKRRATLTLVLMQLQRAISSYLHSIDRAPGIQHGKATPIQVLGLTGADVPSASRSKPTLRIWTF